MATEQRYPGENESSCARKAVQGTKPGDEYKASSCQMTSRDRKRDITGGQADLEAWTFASRDVDVNTAEKIGMATFSG